MSAPILWVFLPVLGAVVFWFLRRRFGLVILLATMLSLGLALAAWLIPFGEKIYLSSRVYQLDTTLSFLGRSLILENSDRPFLIMIFILCGFWFAGSDAAKARQEFIPMSLGFVALLVAARAVEPFLYAALLVEMAVLLAVPILVPPGSRFGQGILRFLIFQSLAVPFILLAGWSVGEVEANPNNTVLVNLSTVFLGLGFAFWLAVFPFYTWLPLLAEQSYPYVSGFLILVLLTVNMMLGLNFLDSYGWLRSTPWIFQVIRLAGLLMVATAGVWAAFQKDLSRLFAYGMIVEIGFSLLAIGLGSSFGEDMFAAMFLPRIIGFGLWALSLSVILRHTPSTSFEDVQGLSNRLPFAAAGLAVASLSVAGLPLLATFPIRQALMEELARQSLPVGLAALVGSVGVLFSTFRALAVLAKGSLVPQEICETRTQSILLVLGIIGILAVGILPQVFLPLMFPLLNPFTNLP